MGKEAGSMRKGSDQQQEDIYSLRKGGNISQVLNDLESAALTHFSTSNLQSVLSTLKKSEELLEQQSTRGQIPDRDAVLSVLTNLACCYQRCVLHRMGALEKCAAYLDACGLYTLPTKSISTKLQDLAQCLPRGKHLTLIHLQLCAVLSQLGHHRQALDKAKTALRLALYCIDCTIAAYKVVQTRHHQTTRSRTTVFDSIHDLHQSAKTALPLLKSVQQVLKSSIAPPLALHVYPDWVYDLSISDIMLLEPVTATELKGKASIREEFHLDFVLEKVINVSVAYFCMSTELHFMKNSSDFDIERDKEEELLHSRALRLVEVFLPMDCPLLQHMSQTYQKRFPVSISAISETGKLKSNKGKLPMLGKGQGKVVRKPSLEPRRQKKRLNSVMFKTDSSEKRMKDRRNRSAELVRETSSETEDYSSAALSIVN